jgi:hypothetical protein
MFDALNIFCLTPCPWRVTLLIANSNRPANNQCPHQCQGHALNRSRKFSGHNFCSPGCIRLLAGALRQMQSREPINKKCNCEVEKSLNLRDFWRFGLLQKETNLWTLTTNHKRAGEGNRRTKMFAGFRSRCTTLAPQSPRTNLWMFKQGVLVIQTKWSPMMITT